MAITITLLNSIGCLSFCDLLFGVEVLTVLQIQRCILIHPTFIEHALNHMKIIGKRNFFIKPVIVVGKPVAKACNKYLEIS